jgi:hypothetical protein
MIERVYIVKRNREENRAEPQHARLKTDNSFPLNKTTSKKRARMRGFGRWGRLLTCAPIGNRRKLARVRQPTGPANLTHHPATRILDSTPPNPIC